jgi:hypothetical protein
MIDRARRPGNLRHTVRVPKTGEELIEGFLAHSVDGDFAGLVGREWFLGGHGIGVLRHFGPRATPAAKDAHVQTNQQDGCK